MLHSAKHRPLDPAAISGDSTVRSSAPKWRSVFVWMFLACSLVVGSTASLPGAVKPAFAAAALYQPGSDAVTPRAVAERTQVTPGTQTFIAVVLDMKPEMHIWPSKPVLPDALKDLEPIATTLRATAKTSPEITAHTGFAQWPEGKPVKVNFTGADVSLISLSDGATIFVPVQISGAAAPGNYTVELEVSYQACNETTCFPPRDDTLRVQFEVVATGTDLGAVNEATTFAAVERTVWARIASGAAPDGQNQTPATKSAGGEVFDFFGFQFRLESTLLILVVSFIAGFLMNFTPCVLPVIPLKINSLQRQAQGEDGKPGRVAIFGSAFCIGILAVFGVIAILALTLKLAFGQWFSYWYVTVPLAAIVGIMGLSMLGLFHIALPQAVYSITPKGETVTGNFLMGVLTAVLSTPCTGPLFGAAFAYAVKQDQGTAGLLVLTMGAGMAFPYALLIAFPGLVKKLPRGGPGGELLKQVLGLFMLAVAAYIGSNVIEGKWPFYIIGGLAGLACLYWAIGALRMLRSPVNKAVNIVIALALLAGCVPATLSLTSEDSWKVVVAPNDDDLRSMIQTAVKAGRPVVVDFTAKWCGNCIVIEKTILNSQAGVKVLEELKPLAIKVDLTRAGPNQGWGMVHEISGGGGIPLIAIFGPGADKPVYFQSFFGVSDLERALKSVSK
jgi:thiol:disulfide interchange protein